uniref:60S acidic ribosomal protein P0 n=1 Tax=Timspurckia oligopyrenoides TaxID=708627 RepID=A0A7S0ZG77_9RHOD|mmetsp:Transcript_406/g.749  ORF Transcript_406/g.749 Transcript_406/m.749 type:complete len:314 (+) Transcript_406:160-1101(+)|eukprot:CAMPEP_0182441186 /NCGR_PEP_ID=MMETSP1172-20130603/135_1 /TAXON_ID=708627 /ORGANISM="Timspurckia oligopyrenoides, Strain CCMP3278" /LENGTH=313 /DNA_ID=CAMNT_0024635353 /DNA_START=80 /DNA_END=1021 /DNA_ORIENTATION=+
MAPRAKKEKYFTKLQGFFEEYDKFFLVEADNVGSNQLQKLRIQLRGTTEIIMGKNTMMRKAIREILGKHPELEQVLPKLVGNVGIVFTSGDLKEIRDIMLASRVPAAARAGMIAQCDVSIPAGPSGMEPTMTSFFQVLNIPTKINKGQIEIMSEVHLVKEGEKVGSSEVALMQKLGLMPFSYSLVVRSIFDKGSMFSSKVLDITPENIKAHLISAVSNIAAISLAADLPTAASVPHSIANGFKKLMMVALGSDVTFEQVDSLKKILDDPEALAALAASAPAAAAAGGDAPAAAAAAPVEEEEEEEEAEFDLFD